MDKKTYHHGNLQEALIEEGLELIHEEGIGLFSLRKLAKRVGVSPTACYNHYQNVEELLDAIKNYVTERFSKCLLNAVDMPLSENQDRLTVLGREYVLFFRRNPHYFTFLFDNEDYHIDLTDTDINGDYLPFQIFRNVAIECLKIMGVPEAEYRDNILAMWAMVHGLAAMANMKHFNYDGDWGELTISILKNKMSL